MSRCSKEYKKASEEYNKITSKNEKDFNESNKKMDDKLYEISTRDRKISTKLKKGLYSLIKDEKTKSLNANTFRIAIITKDKKGTFTSSLYNSLDNMGNSVYLVQYNDFQNGLDKGAYDFVIYTENFNNVVFSRSYLSIDKFGCKIQTQNKQITVDLNPGAVQKSDFQEYCDFYEKYLNNNIKFANESGTKKPNREIVDENKTLFLKNIDRVTKNIKMNKEELKDSENAIEFLSAVLPGLWYCAEGILAISGVPEHMIETKIRQVKQMGIDSKFIKETQEHIAIIEICKFLGSLQIKRF